MRTNTVELHKKIKYLLDQSNSPRFLVDQIDESINDAIDHIMIERFKPESPQDTQRGFQRNRILRDELRPLVKMVSTSMRDWSHEKEVSIGGVIYFQAKTLYKFIGVGTLTPTEIANLKLAGAPFDEFDTLILDLEFEPQYPISVTISNIGTSYIYSPIAIKFDAETNTLLSEYFPEDYNYLALIRIKISGITADPFEITYEQVATVMQDPYSRPSIDMPPRTYQFESNEGYKFLTGDRGIITDVEFYYLSKPVKVKYGKETTLSEINAGESIILGQQNAQVTGTNFNESLFYGDEFIVPAAALPANTVVVENTVNSDMPDSLVREICSRTAKILLVTVENFNKAQQTE